MSTKKPFKPPSFTVPLKAQTSSSINQKNSNKDDTLSKSDGPPVLSFSSSRKNLGVAVSTSKKAGKGSSLIDKECKNDPQQISESAKGEDCQPKGKNGSKKFSVRNSSAKNAQSKNSVSSVSNKTDGLPIKEIKGHGEQLNQNKLKKQLFPDSSDKSSACTTSNLESAPALTHVSLQARSIKFAGSESHSIESDSSCPSSKASSRSVTPIRELLNSVPWGIHVTPHRKEALKNFKKKLALISGSNSGTISTKNTPTFSDHSNPIVESDTSSAGNSLRNEFFTDGTEEKRNIEDDESNTDFIPCMNTDTVDSLASFTENNEREVTRSSVDEISSKFEQIPETSKQESVVLSGEDPSDTANSMQGVQSPKKIVSWDIFDTQSSLGMSETITLIPSSINENSSRAIPVNVLPNTDPKTVGSISLGHSSVEASKKILKTPKPVFKRPVNPNSLQTNKSVPTKDKEPGKKHTRNEIKNVKTQENKAKVTKKCENSINKQSSAINQNPVSRNRSLPMKEKTNPNCKSEESRSKSSTIGGNIEKKSAKKSKDDSQTPVSKPNKGTDNRKPANVTLQNSRKRTARKFDSSEASPKKTRKSSTKDDKIPVSEIITLAASKAGKTGNVPKYVNNRKLTQRERIRALHKLRDVGVWIQCCNSQCSKWRYVDEIKDPIHVPRLWYCKMNPDVNCNSCSKPERAPSPEEEKDLIENSFTAGSVVWARVFGFPFWPAMVEDDPELEQFYWLDDYDLEKVTYYHVTFFDSKGVTRAWIPTPSVKAFKEYENRDTKRLVGKHAIFSTRLNDSRKAALEALKMGNSERLAKFSFINRYTGPIKKKKIGMSCPGVVDSSNSEPDSESQNSTRTVGPTVVDDSSNSESDSESESSADEEVVPEKPSSEISLDKNSDEFGPQHLDAKFNNKTSLAKESSSNLNKNNNVGVDHGHNLRESSSSDCTASDFAQEDCVSSLQGDVDFTELQNLDFEKLETSSHFNHDDIFKDEVTSSQDIFLPNAHQETNRCVTSPVIDSVGDLTTDDVKTLSQESANIKNFFSYNTREEISRSVVSPVMDNVDCLTTHDVETLSQESLTEKCKDILTPVKSTIQRLSQTFFGATSN